MENLKIKLVKSNSNHAISKSVNKKPSNGGFQTLTQVKNRSFKSTKCSLTPKGSSPRIVPVKAPPRPRAGQKRFLASVLNILSKSTTGTQHPDEGKPKKSTEKGKMKHKYKSKVLNELKDQVESNFDIIQYKKDILETPSIYSATSNRGEFKPWELGLPRLVQPDEEELRIKKEDNINQLVKEVTEGRNAERKVTVKQDLSEDKRLYNFFVDLLETTFSVYNMKAEMNPPSNMSSKVAFEIDENVAKKLKEPTIFEDVIQEPPRHEKKFYCLPSHNHNCNDDQIVDYFTSSPSSTTHVSRPKAKKKRKSKSFDVIKATQKRTPRTQNTASQRKSNKKEELINQIKEQLRMDFDSFEEPQTLYQSLRTMAKHKRKKSIRFDSRKIDDIDYQRREPQRELVHQKNSEYTCKRKMRLEDKGSNHSLEVYGYDYEHPHLMKPGFREKLLFAYHSSSDSDRDVDSDYVLQYEY